MRQVAVNLQDTVITIQVTDLQGPGCSIRIPFPVVPGQVHAAALTQSQFRDCIIRYRIALAVGSCRSIVIESTVPVIVHRFPGSTVSHKQVYLAVFQIPHITLQIRSCLVQRHVYHAGVTRGHHIALQFDNFAQGAVAIGTGINRAVISEQGSSHKFRTGGGRNACGNGYRIQQRYRTRGRANTDGPHRSFGAGGIARSRGRDCQRSLKGYIMRTFIGNAYRRSRSIIGCQAFCQLAAVSLHLDVPTAF